MIESEPECDPPRRRQDWVGDAGPAGV